MPLKGGKVDAGVQGGTMVLAQQEAGCLAALGQQGGEDAAQGAAAQQGPLGRDRGDGVFSGCCRVIRLA